MAERADVPVEDPAVDYPDWLERAILWFCDEWWFLRNRDVR